MKENLKQIAVMHVFPTPNTSLPKTHTEILNLTDSYATSMKRTQIR